MKKIISISLVIILTRITFGQPVNTTNVSIGTITNNRAKLEVAGVAPGGATSGAFGTDGAGISLQRNWPTIGFNQYRDNIFPGSQGKYMANGFAALHTFDINSGTMAFDLFPFGTANNFTPAGNRAMTIQANGNIGIRTASSNATITVARGDGIDGTAVFTGATYWSHFNYSSGEATYIRGGTDNSHVYINRIPSGDVYVGNGNSRIRINNPGYNPAYTIDLIQPIGVNALSLFDAFGYSWHQRVSHVNVSGQGDGNVLEFHYQNSYKGRFQYWDGVYQAGSDTRLKTSIQAIPDVMDKVMKLKPVSYEPINDNASHKRTYGFIAQEVKSIFPDLVKVINTNPRKGETVPDLHTMNYSGFGVIAIKALQEQFAQIKSLEKENELLIKRLEAIEKSLK